MVCKKKNADDKKCHLKIALTELKAMYILQSTNVLRVIKIDWVHHKEEQVDLDQG